MFFTNFDPMTPEEVDSKVAACPAAETTIAPSDFLADKLLKFNFDGEFAPSQLDYTFGNDFMLTVTENGTTFKDVPYSALQLRDNVVLFTHTIPGSSRGWHIVYDSKTELATAFETWFGVTVPVGMDLTGNKPPTSTRDIPREVQRQYHFGYNSAGGDKPEKLHTTTNRLEGRGLHWKCDCGSEWLTYFPSVVCSTTVQLDEPQDTVTYTYPSDFIRMNDEMFIFAKWGVEFGGEMWLEVIDMFDLKTIGMKFGFDECNEFEYCMHSTELAVTGDAAHLETITLNGDKAPPMARLEGKGARYAYRPRDIDIPMTKAEAQEAAKTQQIFNFGGPNIMMSGNRLEFKYDLIGKPFSLFYDQVRTPYAWSAKNTPEKLIKAFDYDFCGNETLKWREPGGAWHEEKYICYEPAKDIYFFSHMLTGDPDHACVTHAVDFSEGLATCVYGRVGSWRSDWEIGATCLFGIATGEGIATAPFSKRHEFTTDLIGKSYAWAYSDTMSSIHVYSSPNSYSWTIFQNDNSGGATWSSPSFYIKLRDDAYIFQWVEENCNGSQGLVCFNPRIMHDGGFFFGLNHTELRLNVTGAYARDLGSFNVMKYFDKKADF
ncbi:MAG: molybdenum cofactor biosynthesis F family protein [Oscillospiraceae bacterium]|nr:molybdenum cofactor biosynthesis F family protein [Oscillospiraceae bacterium]